jgi:hypothetical protein
MDIKIATLKNEIQSLLKQGLCEVTFTKVDGTVRTMPCTLREDLLPPAKHEDPLSTKKVREVNEAVMIAYCTDKQAWRSFRVENVISIEPKEATQ